MTACDDAIVHARRLCFSSHFDADGLIDDYVLHYLRELVEASFRVVFVTTATLAPGEERRVDELCVTVVQRPNHGLDFGGWIECLARWPNIEAEMLLLCNDSVYGPFWNLADYIDRLTSRPADAYGATRKLGRVPFLASWFLLLRPSAYRSQGFRAMMAAPVPATLGKIEIIERYEFKLTRALEADGLRIVAAFDPAEMGPVLARHPVDPCYVLWRDLLELRLVPFIKVGLLRDRPMLVSRIGFWQNVLSRLNPKLAASAALNVERRRRALIPVRARRLREFARLPEYSLAELPIAHHILVGEVMQRPPVERPNLAFEAANAVWDLVRWPFARAYARVSVWRRPLTRQGYP